MDNVDDLFPYYAAIEQSQDCASENISLIELLKSDDIITEPTDDNTSELSDWSETDSDDCETGISNRTYDYNALNNTEDTSIVEKKWMIVSYLEPPKKPINYTNFDSSASSEWLDQNIQKNWWHKNDYKCPVDSHYFAANFCDFWYKHLSEKSLNFIKPRLVSTISEYCLIREIIWMFRRPVTSKVFYFRDNQIGLNPNVSLPSCTVEGLQNILEDFVVYMNFINQIESFCNVTLNNYDNVSPHTYQSFASSLRELLVEFKRFTAGIEYNLMNETVDCVRTIIKLSNILQPHFRVLKKLHEIYVSAIISTTEYPPHICSSHLLGKLLYHIENSSNKEDANLVSVLYINTIKTYLTIIDNWWSECRLDDWCNEFLIDRQTFKMHLFEKSKEDAFYVKPEISFVIKNDPIIQLLLQFTVKSSSTLNILQKWDRISELKFEYRKSDGSLYEMFLKEFFKRIESLSGDQNNNTTLMDKRYDENVEKSKNEFNRMEFEKEILEIGDQFLLMAFQESLMIAEQQTNHIIKDDIKDHFTESNSNSQLIKLNQCSTILIPFERFVNKILTELLEMKISVVNSFVVRIYKEEFRIVEHLQNLRRLYLLEASDLMHTFYTTLFQQIESGDNWSNPYYMTHQLDGIISTRYNDMIFNIEIVSDVKSKTIKVLDAIDQIKLNYIVTKELENVINEKNLNYYNKIFRFLLKVKWGLWALENLRFPIAYKKRSQYAELKLFDLLMRRLAMLRFWIINSLQYIHSHLMSQVLQSLGEKFDQKITKCDNLIDIITIHESFLATVVEHCFQNTNETDIMNGLMQLINLAIVVRDEWESCCVLQENNSIVDDDKNNLITLMEQTYIKCHKYFAEVLNNEIILKDSTHCKLIFGIIAVY